MVEGACLGNNETIVYCVLLSAPDSDVVNLWKLLLLALFTDQISLEIEL